MARIKPPGKSGLWGERPRRPGSKGWRIHSIEPVKTVDTNCIQVEAADGLYLVGEHLIPTHNSMSPSTLSSSCGDTMTHPLSTLPHDVIAGELVGWRTWFVGAGRLLSIAAPGVWMPGETMVGDPFAPSMFGEHRGSTNGAGVYAYKSLDDLKSHLTMRSHIRGTVWLWGEVIEHTWGYRAQFAKVRSLDDGPDGPAGPSVKRLRAIYGV